jgi:Transglycosylase SLT domain/Peptidase family M23
VIYRPKLIAVLAGLGALLAALVFGSTSASADTCTVTVKLLTGQTQTLTFPNVPAGTNPSTLTLPAGATFVSGTCTPASTSSSSSTTTTSTTPAPPPPSSSGSSSSSSGSTTTSGSTSTSPSRSGSSSGTTTSRSSTTPAPSSKGKGQKSSSHPQTQVPGARQNKASRPAAKQSHAKKPSKPANLPTGKGVPSANNPTFSLSLPGPAPIGVPNFFINSFQIPPFLIPIYQAAGIEYQVPWQVLAAINEIETDYGRNLSVSSAGAVGWMQFLPSTWKQWGVDANGDGVADPYNPVDAIFTAARYLHAAGASSNLGQAIFAYNHATWYVQSVLLRAQLIGGIPSGLIGALTGLVQGHFPVAAPAKYADDNVVSLAKHKVKTPNAAIAINSNPATRGTTIFAKQGSPVIAVNDGRIVKTGTTPQLGHYVELQDATGNIYTYAHLGSVTKQYPVPKPVRFSSKQIIKEFSVPASKAPKSPASAGVQGTPGPVAPATAGTQTTSASAAPKNKSAVLKSVRVPTPASPATHTTSAPAQAPTQTVANPLVKERLFANPSRPASYAAGGSLQVRTEQQQISNFQNYFSDTLHLARNQYTLKPLRAGSIVVAGTILGRIGGPSQGVSPHLYFMIQPAGKNAPYIDPKPILDGWKLLEATAVYRADGVDPFFGPGAKNPTVGQVLLMSKQQLTERVLADPHVQIYACGRRDIEAGLIDRRVLATIEFLSASGLDPYVSGLECGHSMGGSTGTDAAGSTGASVDISKINGIPVLGHQGPGSITDIAIRRLLTLQGSMRPDQIISDMSYKDQSNTLALPDHKNRIQITFTPDYGTNKKLSKQIKSILQPGQWIQLINRISQIPEPVVPIAPSKYAIRTKNHG